jgi:hypothetical protein
MVDGVGLVDGDVLVALLLCRCSFRAAWTLVCGPCDEIAEVPPLGLSVDPDEAAASVAVTKRPAIATTLIAAVATRKRRVKFFSPARAGTGLRICSYAFQKWAESVYVSLRPSPFEP